MTLQEHHSYRLPLALQHIAPSYKPTYLGYRWHHQQTTLLGAEPCYRLHHLQLGLPLAPSADRSPLEHTLGLPFAASADRPPFEQTLWYYLLTYIISISLSS